MKRLEPLRIEDLWIVYKSGNYLVESKISEIPVEDIYFIIEECNRHSSVIKFYINVKNQLSTEILNRRYKKIIKLKNNISCII